MPNNLDVADSERNPDDNGSISQDAQSTALSSPDAVNAGAPTASLAAADGEQPTEASAAGVEPNASETRAPHQKLWDIIKSCAAPDVLSTTWDFLGKHDNWLRIAMPPNDFVAALEQDYSVEALTELGFYERVGDSLRLPSWLDGDAHLYVAIDDDNSAITFSCRNKSLFPMRRTALDCGLERISQDSTQATDTLFVVESLEAVDIMRRLGLRAVSFDGLDEIGRGDVLRLFAGDQRSDFAWRFQLVLLDFDLANLKNRPTAAIGAVINPLSDATDLYGIDPPRRFSVCRPSPHEFQLLERAVSFEDSTQICQIFNGWSAAAQGVTIDNWRSC